MNRGFPGAAAESGSSFYVPKNPLRQLPLHRGAFWALPRQRGAVGDCALRAKPEEVLLGCHTSLRTYFAMTGD